MTANRPRQTGPLDEVGLIEVLYYGVQSPRTSRHGSLYAPPTDVSETEDLIVVLVEIAGVKQSDFAVSLRDRRLIISRSQVDRGPLNRAYHQMEVPFGDFRTEVDLPAAVDESRVDAEYSDGFLRVRLPKQQPRRIDVVE